jgi:hypothetical protein
LVRDEAPLQARFRQAMALHRQGDLDADPPDHIDIPA